jgi:hypothetical protein
MTVLSRDGKNRAAVLERGLTVFGWLGKVFAAILKKHSEHLVVMTFKR